MTSGWAGSAASCRPWKACAPARPWAWWSRTSRSRPGTPAAPPAGCSAASTSPWRCSSRCRVFCCGADMPRRQGIWHRARRTGHYLRSRVVRIMPAYVVAVVVILTLLPDADHASLTVWLANLTLTQIYVPLTLTGGLTQMWSLSVEVSFYLALPILALLARRLPVTARVPAIAALGALSWAWGWVPIHSGSGTNPLNWPPAFFSWFAAGMLLAEWVHSGDRVAPPHRAPPHGDGRRRGGRLPDRGVAAGRARRPGARHPGTVRGEDRDGLPGGLRARRPAGAGPRRHPASRPGHHRDGDPGALVLRAVRVAPGGAGHGVPGARDVPVHRPHAHGVGVDVDLRFRDRRGQLRPGRVAVSRSVAPLGETREAGRIELRPSTPRRTQSPPSWCGPSTVPARPRRAG